MVLFQPVSTVNSMPLKINYVLITVIIIIIIISDPRAAICSILIQGEQETLFFKVHGKQFFQFCVCFKSANPSHNLKGLFFNSALLTHMLHTVFSSFPISSCTFLHRTSLNKNLSDRSMRWWKVKQKDKRVCIFL